MLRRQFHPAVTAAALCLFNVASAQMPTAPFESTLPFWEMWSKQSVPETSVCFPPVKPGDSPQTDVPCSGLEYFFPNCTYGISLGAYEGKYGKYGASSSGPSEELTPAAQQQCYCSSDYWDYVRGCNACLMTHGFDPSAGDTVYWMPPPVLDQQSSSYCSASAVTVPASVFLSSVNATGMNATPSTSVPVLSSTDTAVSDYYTLSRTLSVPTQTTQSGSLQPTSTGSSSSSSSGGAVKARITAAPALIGGVGLGVAMLGQFV